MTVNDREFMKARRRVLGFFDAEIRDFVLPDIDRLTNDIRPDWRGLKGCTVPLAMLLFSVIDLFGFLMRSGKQSDKKPTEKNFRYLLSASGHFPQEYAANWKKLLKLYRHGMMHQFFPKASAIAKAGPNAPLIKEDNIPTLNVDILSRDVVSAIRQIERIIVQGHDRDLVVRMNRRLDSLAKDDYRKRDELAEEARRKK